MFFILQELNTPFVNDLEYWGYLVFVYGLYCVVKLFRTTIRKPIAIKHFFLGFWDGVKRFGLRMSKVTNFVLLVPVYFLGVGVTSIIAKIAGKRFLLLKLSKNKKSYWEAYNIGREKEEEYYKMY